jgi:tetratricopeptide (TPR) repeat protein
VPEEPSSQPDPRLAKAQALMDVGRHGDALQLITAHLATYPDSVDGLTMLAWCQGQLGEVAAMCHTATQAVARAPEATWPRRVLVYAQLQVEQYDQARRGATELVALDPEQWATHLLLGYAHLAGGGDLRQALSAANQARALAPTEPSVHVLHGTVLDRLGDGRGAEASLRHALALDPNHADALTELSLQELHAGRAVAGVRGLVDVVRSRPADQGSSAMVRQAMETLVLRVAEVGAVGFIVLQVLVLSEVGRRWSAGGWLPSLVGALSLAVAMVVLARSIRDVPPAAFRAALRHGGGREEWQQRNRRVLFAVGVGAQLVCIAILTVAAKWIIEDATPGWLWVAFIVFAFFAYPVAFVSALRLVARTIVYIFRRLRGRQIRRSTSG